MNFPPHKCGLYLEHNTYKDIYTPLEEALTEQDGFWVSDLERTRAQETGDIWTLQWYPNTPVGFYCVAASSLEAVLKAAQHD